MCMCKGGRGAWTHSFTLFCYTHTHIIPPLTRTLALSHSVTHTHTFLKVVKYDWLMDAPADESHGLETGVSLVGAKFL